MWALYGIVCTSWVPSYILHGFFSIVRGGMTCLGLLYTRIKSHGRGHRRALQSSQAGTVGNRNPILQYMGSQLTINQAEGL
jgi:hypothetical protein